VPPTPSPPAAHKEHRAGSPPSMPEPRPGTRRRSRCAPVDYAPRHVSDADSDPSARSLEAPVVGHGACFFEPLLEVFGVEADVVAEAVVGYALLAGLCE
jgi:hypothetical protein